MIFAQPKSSESIITVSRPHIESENVKCVIKRISANKYVWFLYLSNFIALSILLVFFLFGLTNPNFDSVYILNLLLFFTFIIMHLILIWTVKHNMRDDFQIVTKDFFCCKINMEMAMTKRPRWTRIDKSKICCFKVVNFFGCRFVYLFSQPINLSKLTIFEFIAMPTLNSRSAIVFITESELEVNCIIANLQTN